MRGVLGELGLSRETYVTELVCVLVIVALSVCVFVIVALSTSVFVILREES